MAKKSVNMLGDTPKAQWETAMGMMKSVVIQNAKSIAHDAESSKSYALILEEMGDVDENRYCMEIVDACDSQIEAVQNIESTMDSLISEVKRLIEALFDEVE